MHCPRGFTWFLTLLSARGFTSSIRRRFHCRAPVDLRPDFRGIAHLRGGDRPLQPVALLPDLRALCGGPVGQADARDAALPLPVVGLLAAGAFRRCPRRGRRRNAAPVERATAVPRRRAKRNQRLPVRKAAAVRVERGGERSIGKQVLLLLLEKVPLLALSVASAIITPYAQHHGGSMASSSELSPSFRIENALQSYMTYITRMFWPGKMSVLYFLDVDHVNHVVYGLRGRGTLGDHPSGAVGGVCGRRYLAVGWFWYVGTLVPVIGIVQVGEQTHADRYTYIPYIGLFIMLAWGIADLIGLLPQIRKSFQFATGFAMMLVLVTCVGWTKYQLQFWTGVEVHLRHALTITPDNWNMLNNLGVYLWKQAQEQDVKAGKAEAESDMEKAKAYREKAVALKDDAKAQWIHGITARPTATDIHSNLGYAYSEAATQAQADGRLKDAAEYLDKAEWHLNQRRAT